jgi:hypothetical protein
MNLSDLLVVPSPAVSTALSPALSGSISLMNNPFSKSAIFEHANLASHQCRAVLAPVLIQLISTPDKGPRG